MYEAERACAVELAREAGRVVLDLYDQEVKVSWKSGREPVTAADLASNRTILRGLSRRFPDDAILSEESADDRMRLNRQRVWIVDPLDGTQEFVDRVGQFAIMIGLAVGGEPVVGAVYRPVGERLWHASEGGGAVVEEKDGSRRALAVSKRTRDDGLRLVVTRSHRFRGIEEIRAELGIREVKHTGSVGLKVGAIAADEADLYVHISKHTKEWDTCAPHAILREAGGRMTDLATDPLTYNRKEVRNLRGILASNGPIHERAARVVAPYAHRVLGTES